MQRSVPLCGEACDKFVKHDSCNSAAVNDAWLCSFQTTLHHSSVSLHLFVASCLKEYRTMDKVEDA